MDEAAKRRFDAVFQLYQGCWQRIAERRSYEWKITLTLWTAFALLIGVLLTGEIVTAGRARWAVTIGVFGIGSLVVLAHGCYLWGVGLRHTADREMAFHYERILQELSDACLGDGVQDSSEEVKATQMGAADLTNVRRRVEELRHDLARAGVTGSGVLRWEGRRARLRLLFRDRSRAVQLWVSAVLLVAALLVSVLHALST